MNDDLAPQKLPDTGRKPAQHQESRHLQPDWLLLPMFGIFAIVLTGLCLELLARELYPQYIIAKVPCLIVNDPLTGVRALPNSICTQKTLESGRVEYRYNRQGHREDSALIPKAPGTYRIVLIGSSLAEGWTVPRKQSFAALLPAMLSQATGKKIEIYNEGLFGGSPIRTDLRFSDVLAAQPDLILYPVTPWDIDHVTFVSEDNSAAGIHSVTPGEHAPPTPGLMRRVEAKWQSRTDLAESLGQHSRAFFMLQHLLYKSGSIYLAHSIAAVDADTPSIENQPNAHWQNKLDQFASYFADMERQAKDARVLMVVVPLPRHAQAVMIASDTWPSSLNPFRFSDQLQAIVQKNGGTYINILPFFREEPNIHSGFYPVDQHLNAKGQAMFADVMTKGLTSGAIAALAGPSAHVSASEETK